MKRRPNYMYARMARELLAYLSRHPENGFESLDSWQMLRPLKPTDRICITVSNLPTR